MTESATPLSWMIRQSQLDVAQFLATWFWAFVRPAQDSGYGPPGQIEPGWAQKGPVWDGRERKRQIWTPEHQVFDARQGSAFRMTFEHQGWDPDLSEWRYGPEQVISNQLEVLHNHTWLIDNSDGVSDIDVDETEEVVYANTRSTSTSETISLDFGAKQTGTIGGDSVGASLEVQVSESLGIKTDKSQAESETKTTTRSQHIKTTVPQGKALMATISSPTQRTSRHFEIDGVWLASFTMDWLSMFDGWGYIKQIVSAEDRVTHIDGNSDLTWLADEQITQVKWTDVDDFLNMCRGRNTDFPDVADLPPPYLDFGISAQLDQKRRIVWSGREMRVSQDAADYKFSDVTGNAAQFAQAVREDHIIKAA